MNYILKTKVSVENQPLPVEYIIMQSNLCTHRNSIINQFPANVPIMEKPGIWFLRAKCMKNTTGVFQRFWS